jgi:hypothetical protein
MEMILQQVSVSQMMSLLDDFSGYNQIKVKREDKYKTTFITRLGTFSYERMPFGLSNEGATFQRAMQIAFDNLIGKIIQIYLDDLTVYSKNQSDHFGNLKRVLMQCRKFDISLNPSNSIFGVTKGKLLGHIVSYLGISIDLERNAAILNLPAPTSKKEVQYFMGVINFVRRFVPDFVVMVKLIHNLLKQDLSFAWTDDVEDAFVGIKKEISSVPVLAKPDFEKEFMVYTNAIEEAVYDILMQGDDQGNKKPVAYMSQILSDDEFKYFFIEKHAFTLVKVVEKFLHFILGKHALVKVPLPAIKFFLSQTYLSWKLAHWLSKIQEHYLTIATSTTIKGRDLALHLAQNVETSEETNEHDSSLSTLFYIDNHILPVSEHPWYNNLVYYLKNQRCSANLETHQRRRCRLESARYVIIGDFLFRRSIDGMLLRCVNNEEAKKLLQETHGSSNYVIHMGGHFSTKTTAFKIIRKGYYWPSIFRDSYVFSRSCDKCQKFAGKERLSAMSLQPLLPDFPFSKWGLDFIGPINPLSLAGQIFILTSTYYFTKWDEIVPL